MNNVFGINNTQISGDALNPSDDDLIAQVGMLHVDQTVPDGWNVLSGNHHTSSVGRVTQRWQFNDQT
tara:strand:+ start:5131 stop:5331 length:201 start_codon:yes stop_codon:yes gene_type:complete